MKAIVCVKQVPDTQGKVAVKADGTMDRSAMATITNPDDLNAVEAALQLKDETGCEVVVVTMGPPPAEGMLPSTRSASAPRTSFSVAVRPSTVIPLRSAPRSPRSCICPRSPMSPTFRRTATA